VNQVCFAFDQGVQWIKDLVASVLLSVCLSVLSSMDGENREVADDNDLACAR